MTFSSTHPKKRIFYFDALRALAIICVIIIHAYARNYHIILTEIDPYPTYKYIYTHMMSDWFRIGVDLFLMLSGALSLGRNWEIKDFLGKRIPRIVSPFLFWGITLSLLMIICSYYFNFHIIKSYDFMSILNYIYNSFLAHNKGFTPYWFFWMILGTYLIMPIFNKWLILADLKEAEYFLVFWLITCLFDATLLIDFPIKLNYFTSPIGLVVLGYYLRHTERKLLNNPYFDILLIAVPCIVMLILSVHFSTPNKFFVFARYSLPVSIEVMGIFLLFKNFSKLPISFNFLKNQNGIFRKSVAILAKYSYGIYLIHAVIQYLLLKLPIHGYNLRVFICIFVALFLSVLVMDIFNRIPYINQIIGAK
ncbi:MAG: acyltransferase [Methanobrevibacter thaueri]|uniref:Acyltransferase n=1 Tax=Methanobrevibacter thaueri TaxID=190975 RepID=A0A8T3V424_9EURY|nr:acyltransferase [Methanobrevibacter thaueri]MBE6501061.1 acyltransferase [Methanobrevibacter thaueri]